MRSLIILPVLIGLAACGRGDDEATVTVQKDGGKAQVSVGGETGLKIDADGFKAALDIPGMEIGGKNFDIDGMKLFPGSTVKGMKVVARDGAGGARGNGTVTVTFLSPAAPAAVLDHAAAQARDRGYVTSREGLTLTGREGDGEKSIVYRVVADGANTTGTIALTGTE